MTMRIGTIFIIISLSGLFSGCLSSKAYEQLEREDLDRCYSLGIGLDEIHQVNEALVREYTCVAEAYDEYPVKRMLDQVSPKLRGKITGYEVYRIYWSIRNSSNSRKVFFSDRMYEDYVFYDASSKVIWSFRVFVD